MPLLTQMGQRGLGDPERAEQIGFQLRSGFVFRRFFDGSEEQLVMFLRGTSAAAIPLPGVVASPIAPPPGEPDGRIDPVLL